MKDAYANCGLNCAECGAYIATQTNSDEKRKEIVEQWSKAYGSKIEYTQVNCDGCRAGGVLIGDCNQCPIRVCGNSKNLENCAQCPDYICETLGKFLSIVPAAKANLEAIRAML